MALRSHERHVVYWQIRRSHWALFSNIGLSPSRLRESGRSMAAIEQNILYKREAHAGDTLEVFSHPIEIKAKTLRFLHTMIDCESGEVSATVESVAAHLDTTARKAVEFPDDIREKVQALIIN